MGTSWLKFAVLACLFTVHVVDSCSCSRRRKEKPPASSRACKGPLPCYDISMVFIGDGPLAPFTLNDERGMIQHYDRLTRDGRSTLDGRRLALSYARKAIDFYRRKYGFDFSHLRDDQLLSGSVADGSGSVTFTPAILGDARLKFRLYVGTNGDQSQVFNRPISDYGWLLVFTQDTPAPGPYGKTIPAGAIILYGSIIILPCDDTSSYSDCRNILNPTDPQAPIHIQYNSAEYFAFRSDPVDFGEVNCEAYNDLWGKGVIRGTSFQRQPLRSGGDVQFEVRDVVLFPAYK